MGDLVNIAKRLVVAGKGIFAADASPVTLGKRAAELGIKLENEEDRRVYRLMTVETPGLGEFVSGVILHDEAIRRSEIREAVERGGMVLGVKVDRGSYPLAKFAGEEVTEGLDGLRERLKEYAAWGAKFTKWRGVVRIGERIPTRAGIFANAHALARYAALAQEAGLVPVVEPEVLMEGEHTLAKCAEVTEEVGRAVFGALAEAGVEFESIVYKPNMVLPGKKCAKQVSDGEAAQRTVEVMKKIVPVEVPGIAFLSGGQEATVATARLDAMNRLGGAPWKLTFSFERAIEGPAMAAWAGREESRRQAQAALLHRARMNSLASRGQYEASLEGVKNL